MLFRDRADAGEQLAEQLLHLRGQPVVVLGLPRGGVPVAAQVARVLGAPLDVIVVRKLGVPFQPELGMGAVGEDGVLVIDPEIVRQSGVSSDDLAAIEARERAEVEQRVDRYRGARQRVPLSGQIAVIIDDGIATGSTARAACQVARALGAARIVLAVPVASHGWEERIGHDADEMVCAATPSPFFAIGQFYDDFSQTSDAEVERCLSAATARTSSASLASRPASGPPAAADLSARSPAGTVTETVISAGAVQLPGELALPDGATGIVLFAHGSGSSRHSARNRYVAAELTRAGSATVLFDLLTPDEEQDRANVFDVGKLAERLTGATAWVRAQPWAASLPVGYFGASTGAAAALLAAATPGADIAAVVSRGGRPDLAGPDLRSVRAPTLLIVGGADRAVLDLNRLAQAELRCENELAIVPGATHLFEEPGTLAQVAKLALDWFDRHFRARS